MSKESDAIEQVFQIHEEAKKERSQSLEQIHIGTSRLTFEEKEWADEEEAEVQDFEQEPYHPIQRREDNSIGCLGGVMFAVFVLCISFLLACLGWMAASGCPAGKCFPQRNRGSER